MATASAMLNAFHLYSCRALHYPELCFDIVDGRMQPLRLPWPVGRSAPDAGDSSIAASGKQ